MNYRMKGFRIDAPAAVLGFFMLLMAAPGATFADTQWNVGVSGGDGGITGFHLSIGDYYDVPEREVVVIHDRGIHDEDLPVVFFLSQHAHVPPEVIVDMRLRGMSWMDITFHYGLHPDIYYVPVPVYADPHHHHPPYGKAWGHYGKYKNKNDWRRAKFTDAEVVNQVNLRFMKDHYGYAPDRIMQYRSEGKRFNAIDRQIWREKNGRDKDNYYGDGKWRQGHDQSWDRNRSRSDGGKHEMNSGRNDKDYRNQGTLGGKKEKSYPYQEMNGARNDRPDDRHGSGPSQGKKGGKGGQGQPYPWEEDQRGGGNGHK